MLYAYNTTNGEFAMEIPFENEPCEGKTNIEPPKAVEGYVRIFNPEKKKWANVIDYRFTHKLLKVENTTKYLILNIEEPGDDFPEGFELITNEAAEVYEKKNALNALCMTKLDFYKFVLSPNGITYDVLLNVLKENIELQATWDLCQNVFRGDDFLNKYIKKYIPNITDEQLDEIFEEHGKILTVEN